MSEPEKPADALPISWVDKAPFFLQPYLRLSRYDRPVGFWLLALPCWMGLVFASGHKAFQSMEGLFSALYFAPLFLIGAIAMRGAGCTYNDILDADLDAKVTRTALRPIPSGRVNRRKAAMWMLLQCLIGLLVLTGLPLDAQIIALGAIPLVAAYPLMKRITWWPQVWLGLTFNWGFLVGVAAMGSIGPAALVSYIGLIFWTIGYDTIYALQDMEDDTLIGVKSTARRFGTHIRSAVSICFALMTLFLGIGSFLKAPLGWTSLVLVLPALIFGHMAITQIQKLDLKSSAEALMAFKNHVRYGSVYLLLSIMTLVLAMLISGPV